MKLTMQVNTHKPVQRLPTKVKLKDVVESFLPWQPKDGCSVDNYFECKVNLLKQTNQHPSTHFNP